VFVNGGEQTLTSLVFPREGQHTVDAATTGGNITLKSFTYTPLANAR
jgi:levanase